MTGLTIGTITGIAKTGWQYMDVIHVAPSPSRTTTGYSLMVPGEVLIHTVYTSGDLSVLGIGTS